MRQENTLVNNIPSDGPSNGLSNGLSNGSDRLISSVANGIEINDDRKDDSKDAILLRWSRVTKSVSVKSENQGLMRGSIAEPTTPQSREDFGTKMRRLSSDGMRERAKKQVKTILNQVSGYAAPGEIVAMMGPSGSGKTSLLNCLSGRNPYNSGVISVNGQVLHGSDMKRLMAKIAYVKQADVFFEHLTVRDQLGYTAMLRLPEVWTKQKKMEDVERIIRLLRLNDVANSEIRLLSGGEKKRVNIGTELLTDPSVLLLDEPTSGLDSTSAVALVKMLQRLARTENKTIITSIHQPSSALFASFDRLVMLAEGNVVYFGNPRESIKYLRQQTLECPDGYNAADHWMDLLVQDSAIEEEEEGDLGGRNNTNGETETMGGTPTPSSSTSDLHEIDNSTEMKDNDDSKCSTECTQPIVKTKRQQLIEAWDKEAVAEQIDFFVEEVKTNRLSLDISMQKEQQTSKYNTSWGLQYRTLVHRSLKNSRSAIFTTINLSKSCALGVVSGLLWFQMEYTESRIFDRSSYFFFTMTFWVFDAMFQSLMAFPIERTVILKERASGSYQLSAYFMGKTTSEMPARLILPMIYMIISFWMAAISPKFSMFIATTLISLLSVMAGEAIGLFIGATIYDTEKAMTVMTVISLFLVLIGGFFIENVPSFLAWSKFFSPFKYSFDASLQLVFDRPVPCDGSGALEELCNGSDSGYASVEDVREFLGVQGSVGFNVGILIAIGLVPRYFAYLALRSKKEGDR